jgi:hypothetical protein
MGRKKKTTITENKKKDSPTKPQRHREAFNLIKHQNQHLIDGMYNRVRYMPPHLQKSHVIPPERTFPREADRHKMRLARLARKRETPGPIHAAFRREPGNRLMGYPSTNNERVYRLRQKQKFSNELAGKSRDPEFRQQIRVDRIKARVEKNKVLFEKVQ